MSGKNSSSERNKAEAERSSKLNKMIQMRQEALEIKDRLMSSNITIVEGAEKDLERLQDQFFDESQDMMAPEQYEAAKDDFGYFLMLIEMAIAYYVPKGYESYSALVPRDSSV